MDNTTNIIYNIQALDNATAVINSVSSALSSLRSISKAKFEISIGISGVSKLKEVKTQIAELASKAGDIEKIKQSLNSLSEIGSFKNLSSTVRALKNLPDALNGLGNIDETATQRVVNALKPLENLQKSNLGSTVSQLKQFPKVLEQINNIPVGQLSIFSKRVELLTKYLQPLAVEMDKISNGFSKLPNKIQQAITSTAKLSETTKQLNNSTEKASASSGKLLKNIIALAKRYISLRKIIDFVVSSVKESAEWTENIHLFEVAFDSASDEAYAFGKTISDTFNTSINETMRYLAVFRQMTDAIGIADDTATRMSETLTSLGYDIASLYNISIESAMEKLEAGIAGQTKPLRTLGMDITAQSLDNYLEQELKLANITSKQMTQADKMILRTIVIMDQAQNAYGDMALTINTFSNQVKVMQGAFDNFKLALGDLVKTYMQPFVTYTAGVLIAITDIMRAFAPLEDTSGIDNLTNSLVGVDEELQDIAETAGLLSFDKFNALTSGDEGGINASNITSLLEQVLGTKYEEYMETFNKNLESVSNKAEEIAIAIKSWVFPFAEWDTETGELVGELGRVNDTLTLIWTTLKLIVSISLASKITKLIPLVQTAALQMKLFSMDMRTAGASVASFKTLLESLSGVVLVALIYQVIDLITKWDELSTTEKVLRSALALATLALWLYSSGMGTALFQTVKFATVGVVNAIKSLNNLTAGLIAKHIPTLLSLSGTIGGLAVGLAALAGGIIYYISSLDEMSTTAKVLIPVIAALSAVFVGLAVAKAAASAGIAAPAMAAVTAAALTAGIVLAAGTAMSVASYETGGLPEKGHLFIANENGNPELVGNIGGNNAVANNDMIVTAIENAAFRGFVRAIDTTNAGSGTSKSSPIVLNINGREFARATATDMADEFGRRNIKLK